MKLLRDLLLIDPIFEAQLEHEKLGIVLPDYAENVLPWRGKVLNIGPDVKDIKIGETVIFDRMRADMQKGNGHKIKLDKDVYILPRKLIYAICKQ